MLDHAETEEPALPVRQRRPLEGASGVGPFNPKIAG